MTERNLQAKCIAYLKGKGIYYINKYGDGRSAKGAPDLYICIHGLFVTMELKVGKNGLQEDQLIHKRRIERSGGLWYSPRTLSEFVTIVEELQCESNN